MATISQTDAAAPDGDLETDLEQAEHRLRTERAQRLFGDHPDGVGPTLGQDLGTPNPGIDVVDYEDEGYDPPT